MSEAANNPCYNEDIDSKMEEIKTDAFEKKVENEYKIYDLNDKQDRTLFANSLVKHSFALIHMSDQYKSSFDDLFTIFKTLFESKQSLECDQNAQYIGYTYTPNVKQSLWFNLDQNNTLFPCLKNKKNTILYEPNNYKKVIKAYNIYNDIARDAIQSILQNVCNNKDSYLKCQNNLFPLNANNKNYEECAVYHKYRKSNDLQLNNLAAIHYYGINNQKPQSNPCSIHIDYTLITLIIANESGLTVFDKHKGKTVYVNDIIKSHNINTKDVIAVITGLTGAYLTDRDNEFQPVPCRHSVRKTYKCDRISFPLFCYANPNGIIDTSLIKNTNIHEKINVATLIAKEMRGSVNF